jgi:hypothetical protein
MFPDRRSLDKCRGKCNAPRIPCWIHIDRIDRGGFDHGMMAAAAVPRYAESLHFHRAQSAASRLVADLHRVAASARASSEPRMVHFDVAAGRYFAFPRVSGIGRHNPKLFECRCTDEYGVTIRSVTFADGNWLVFNGYGFPESEGKIVFDSGNKTAAVTVNVETGEITVEASK